MSTSKVERLTNLVIGLLSTTQFVPIERIRRDFAGYNECASEEAFGRMFERDKAALRDLGIPLTFGGPSGSAEDQGYRITRTEYELPPITLTPEEGAAVAVAGRLWHSPEMASTYSSAIVKLRAAGIAVDDAEMATVVGGMGTALEAEPALAGLVAAVDGKQAVTFEHLAAASGVTSPRTLEPWGVASAKGNWYVVGFDRDRQEQRTFRLSRIVGGITPVGQPGQVRIPDDVDPAAIIRSAAAEPVSEGSVTVWLSDGHAHDLRRSGTEVAPHTLDGVPGTVVRIPVGSRTATIRAIAAHGADAVALVPEDIREAVIDTLRGAAAAHSLGTAGTRADQEERR
ncbi:helix-turn-helix transcriptional regulator [Tomitella gaofuii]|uniref:helix-turn-helix transcriptional regulator n=1 Tax=Tomitella gaofuii TaxID=2760083 RepID=UPI0015F9D4E8|nr:WYL domain-containing protein [Tomitella gaofuii]